MYSENRSKLCPNVFTKSYSSQSLHHTLWRIGFIQKKKKKKKSESNGLVSFLKT